MLRVYLDNDVVSAISRIDQPRDPVETTALNRLLNWQREGRLRLATSRQAHREMERAGEHSQRELKAGLEGIEIAPDDHVYLGSSESYCLHGPTGSQPLVSDIVDEPLFSALQSAGLKSDDAKHFMYAVHNKYSLFLTWDRHFLNRVKQLAALCPTIRVQRPSEFVAEMATQHGTRSA